MLYHFVYDPTDPVDSYAVFSDNMQHYIAWSDWAFGVYKKDSWYTRTFVSFIQEHSHFIRIASFDYPILPSEIMQLHPEYFI